MNIELIRPHRTYETPAGYRLRVQQINHDAAPASVQYRVVRGSWREPLDLVGKVGEASLYSFARRVKLELPKVKVARETVTITESES